MDADLQNDPADIKRLLEKLDEGFDVVSGWRKERKDELILASNSFMDSQSHHLLDISGVRLHDYGCSLKAYRKEVIKDVRLYGEMHRFVPIYATWLGAKVSEIPVNHQATTIRSIKIWHFSYFQSCPRLDYSQVYGKVFHQANLCVWYGWTSFLDFISANDLSLGW
jgi:hypothetical protein